MDCMTLWTNICGSYLIPVQIFLSWKNLCKDLVLKNLVEHIVRTIFGEGKGGFNLCVRKIKLFLPSKKTCRLVVLLTQPDDAGAGSFGDLQLKIYWEGEK